MLVFRTLQCVGLPKDLPEAITLDISSLNIGGAIRINSIVLPGLTFLDPANAVVVSVKMARGALKGEELEDDKVETETVVKEVATTPEDNSQSEETEESAE